MSPVPFEQLLDPYRRAFPLEAESIRALSEFLQKFPNGDAINRNNHVAHITASAILVDLGTRSVLRVLHPTFQQRLVPGGHLLPSDASPLEAAKRKAEEEVNAKDLTYVGYHFAAEAPIDIDGHRIAAFGEEPAHYHWDFRYVFMCERATVPGVTGQRLLWQSISTLKSDRTYARLAPKLERLLSMDFLPQQFYHDIVSMIQADRRVQSVVVCHMLPDAEHYIEALDTLTTVSAVIPKPRSRDAITESAIASRVKVIVRSREDLREPEAWIDLLPAGDDPVVLFDIGGWFSESLPVLATLLGTRLLGVIEDTENGHQKYERLAKIGVPVVSVARSPLKDNEDFLIGQSVVFSAEAVLRHHGKLLAYLSAGVIGYGKIGRSIAHHLVSRGVKPFVAELNPLRAVEAKNRLCEVVDHKALLGRSDLVFCATGNRALDIHNFRCLRPGAFVFSVTSADDELDLSFLAPEYSIEPAGDHLTIYSGDENHFYLVNDGNAVNFLHKAVVGDYICLVRAEMLWALGQLRNAQFSPGIHQVSTPGRETIASLWLETSSRLGRLSRYA